MKKIKTFYKTRFPFRGIAEAHHKFLELHTGEMSKGRFSSSHVRKGNESWYYDTSAEFAAAYDGCDSFSISHYLNKGAFSLSGWGRESKLEVEMPNRADIDSVFACLEKYLDESRIESSEEEKIFIGHGRDQQWRELKDHLQEKHGFKVVAYEIGPRAGMSVKEVLQKMLDSSGFAFLILTGEDMDVDGGLHARENVIHELGLFQGRLGFLKAIAMLEDGVKEFSNILGVNQIRFPKGMIRASFGEVLATISRENSPEI